MLPGFRLRLVRLAVLVAVVTPSGALHAQGTPSQLIFGPKQYLRTAGPPNQYTDTFPLPAGATGPFLLHLVNGNPDGTKRVSSATVTLNGTTVAGPSDFNQNVAVIDRTVTLQASNMLVVQLTSAPGSVLTISVLATSVGPQPTSLTPNPLNLPAGQTGPLTATLAPAPTTAGTLTVSSADPTVATVPASVAFAVGQTSVPMPVTAVAVGSTTITVTLNGGSAASQVTVTPPPPRLSGFIPTAGRVGDAVTLTGTNFVNVQAVAFNGVPTPTFTVQNTTTLLAVVPAGATTGPLAVTTAAGTGTSIGAFVVVPTQDFQLSVAPATVTIPASGQAALLVSLTGSGGFTNLATLAVTGLPTGMTATFGTPTLTAGQQTLLTLTTSGSTPAGSATLTVTATGPVQGVTTPRSAGASVQVLAAGTTTLSGQVLNELAQPVPGAVAKLGPLTATSDAAGNFLLLSPPAGANQLFFIDGGPASTPTISYPIIPYAVTITAGQANTLGFTPYLHFQKTTGLVDISNSTVQRVVTDPDIPGLQMTIPVGVTITGWDGQPNTQVSIRRVPIDRTPLPSLPAGRVVTAVYMDYFGKQGGGTPSAPIPITFPNDLGLPPGTSVELWFYDEAPDGSRPNQWAQYGTGTVSANGSQVTPDLNPATGQPYGQPRFCCGAGALSLAQLTWQAIQNQLGGIATALSRIFAGEPVDLATGLFVLEKTDLVLPGRLPMVFTRTYKTGGAPAGPFGPGTSHRYHRLLLIQNTLRILVLPDGARALFAQQSDGTFRNLTDPLFQGAVLTASGSSHTLREKDGTTWTFGPPVAGVAFLIGQADRTGNTVTLTRSGAAQNLTVITDAAGRQIALTYDPANRITALQDPLGRTVVYHYDNQGHLATVTDPNGGVTRYTYDNAGRLLTITDARGITFLTNQYDPNGRVSQQTQADGGVWTFAYTTSGGVITQTTVTDPRGQSTTHRFTGPGYPLSQTDGLGQTTTVTRDSGTSLVLATTDPLGRTTSSTYDANGNVTSILDPANNLTRFTYDPTFNRVTSITDALNQVTQFGYDPSGNLTSITDPLTQTTTLTYNSAGQPLTVTDPLTHPTSFAYDPVGDLITTTDPLGNQTQRVSDAVSRLIRLTDPRGFQTQFRYDPLNRVDTIADAHHGLTGFTYDPNGNLLTVTDAKNQATAHTYDGMDRLATRIDALTRQETYRYDPDGNLTQFLDRKGQASTFTYDALNRRTVATYADGSTVTFTYDAVGRLTRVSDAAPGAGAIDFYYDLLDRLILEVTPQGAVASTYDAMGRRTSMTVAGQAPVTYQYDADSRLTQVAQGSLTVSLGYDAAGRRTLLTYPNGVTTTYTYDNANRVTTILHSGPGGTTIESLSYTYDAGGNRTSLNRANGTASLLPAVVGSATYDAANEQTQFGTATLTYDANGNLTNDGTNSYAWDARNRLVSISGGVTASFAYDPLGRRVSKTINGVTTNFLYDGIDITAEIQGGAVVATYLRSIDIDEPFVRQGMVTEFYHGDELGSTLALTSLTGSVQANYSYDPFGRTTMTGASLNPFQFTGRENDEDGLYYYRARYYAPQQQRFTSEDPLEFESGDVNRYAYVFNGPTNDTDPTGEIVPALLAFCGRNVLLNISFDILSGRKPSLSGAFLGCIPGFGQLGKLPLGAVSHYLANNPFINNLLKNLPVISRSKNKIQLQGSGGASGANKLFQQLSGGNPSRTISSSTQGSVQHAPIPGGGDVSLRGFSSPPNSRTTVQIDNAGSTQIKIRF